MKELSETELAEIGREAAREVAGLGEVEDVEGEAGFDWTDKPAYFFNFLVDRRQENGSGSTAMSRLRMNLRNLLIERGDERYPFIRVLSREGWAHRGRA